MRYYPIKIQDYMNDKLILSHENVSAFFVEV